MLQETSDGLIVIGGSGPNTYELDKGIGLIIDVGGNDPYRDMIAASTDEDQGDTVVINLNGDDTYHGAPLELATGRLRVGLLIGLDGDDVYHLDMGSRGAGFGVLGLFIDEGGEDQYQSRSGFGDSSEKSMAGFFVLEGTDIYALPSTSSTPANARPRDGGVFSYPQGDIVVDR
ncbi:MAG: hypothetical protein ABI988_02330 [Nitrospirota bacterium]